MSLKPYEVDIDGIMHTLLLDDADAERRGLRTPATAAEDVDALVDAKLAELTAAADEALAARLEELEADYEARVNKAVDEALAAAAELAQSESGRDDVPGGEPVKAPRSKKSAADGAKK